MKQLHPMRNFNVMKLEGAGPGSVTSIMQHTAAELIYTPIGSKREQRKQHNSNSVRNTEVLNYTRKGISSGN